MAYITNWSNPHGDSQSTNRSLHTTSGLELHGKFSLTNFSLTSTILSNIIVAYSETEGTDVIFFVQGSYTSSARQLVALKINENEPAGQLIPLSDVLWTTNLETNIEFTPTCQIIMSNDGETIFIMMQKLQTTFYAINTSNGSTRWSFYAGNLWPYSPPGDPTSGGYPMCMSQDKNGDLIIAYQAHGDQGRIIKIIDNETYAEFASISHTFTTASTDNALTIYAMDSTKRYGYFCGYFTSLPSGWLRINKFDTDGGVGNEGDITAEANISFVSTYTKGLFVNGNNLYISVYRNTNQGYGLYKYDLSTPGLITYQWVFNGGITTDDWSTPTITSDGTIYIRAGTKLWSLTDNGDTYTENWSTPISILPDDTTFGVTSDASGLIYAPSGITGGTGQANLHIITDDGSEPSDITAYSIGDISATRFLKSAYAYSPPVIGSNSFYYASVQEQSGGAAKYYDIIYVYRNSTPTTTTTTLPPGSSSSESSEDDESSSSSESEGPVTTTTTTTQIPNVLSQVKTVIFINGKEIEINDASDSDYTINTPFAKSLTFGTLSPNELSETMIIALKLPYAKALKNIRLGLVDTGGLEFTTNRFGVYSSSNFDENIVPTTYFQGINTNKLESSIYNVTIDSNGSTMSDYVYLNVKMPEYNTMRSGTIRYKWFFDYSD